MKSQELGMSGTQTPPPVQQSATNQNTTQGTAVSAAGVTAAVVGLSVAVLKHFGWTVAPEDVGYASTLIFAAIHYAMVRLKVAGA
jgi:hypothetical protein